MHHHNETAKIAATHFCLGNISKCETKTEGKKTQQHKHAMIMYLRILINIS